MYGEPLGLLPVEEVEAVGEGAGVAGINLARV